MGRAPRGVTVTSGTLATWIHDLDPGRGWDRAAYYAGGIARAAAPQWILARRLSRRLAAVDPGRVDGRVRARVNYCNRMSPGAPLPKDAVRVDALPRGRSRYYFDLVEQAKPFGRELRVGFLYGDITEVPQDAPRLVKSRPVAGDNANSVLLKLNKLRHFRWVRDRLPFEAKRPAAVWRGRLCNEMRRTLVAAYGGHPDCDVGYVGHASGFDPGSLPEGDFLSPEAQLGYRYVLSLEGNDVATNLKWVMASNSLCLMPRPRFETWFMEGTLVPGEHYAEVREDFADLEDVIAQFERRPDEAKRIVANANAYAVEFRDARRERLVSDLVMQKYFERTSQLPPQPFSVALFD